MQTIQKKLMFILISCSFVAILITSIFVNLSMSKKFDEYITDIQSRRNDKIVSYFNEIYKKDKNWSKSSGIEIQHEAYMGNYALTLLDKNKQVVWGMEANNLKAQSHMMFIDGKDKGVYNSHVYEIKYDDEIVGYVDIAQYSSVILSKEDINFKDAINTNIIFSGIITVLFVSIISVYISKQFSVPIKEVSDISVKLSKGEYDFHSNTKSNILELENLRNSINTLGDRLDKQEVIRKRLVSDISHEIRTPLNVLQNNLEAMIDGVFPITEEKLISLNEEVIRFGGLLDNLNMLKKFDEEMNSLDMKKVSIKDIIISVCDDFELAFKEKNIELITNICSKDECIVEGDEDKLKQVFINLLSNALKFNYDGGKIWVDLNSNKNNITIKIKDTGMGISKEDLPFIFERLYRCDKSRNEIEGSGIGLTVVKKILILHSGSIDVESEEKKGSTFTITFNREF